MIIFIYFKNLYNNVYYVYQLYFRFAYLLDNSEGGGPDRLIILIPLFFD